jgi:hypothetical protein
VLLNDVRVVEKPFSGWTYVDTTQRRISEPLVYFIQYFARVIQAIEQRTVSALFSRRKKAMLPRNLSCVTREAIGPENFAAYRPHQFSVCTIVIDTKEPANPARRFLRRDYCSCHE